MMAAITAPVDKGPRQPNDIAVAVCSLFAGARRLIEHAESSVGAARPYEMPLQNAF